MDHSEHQQHNGHSGSKWLLGGLGAAGALTLAPYALPLLGHQSMLATQSYMHHLSGHAEGLKFGDGIAGDLNEAFSHLPLIGETLTSTATLTIPGIGISLATGAVVSIAATAIIGIGGMLLANWMEKRESADATIRWSKIIRVVALSTSLLIALPSIISGISVGLMFLAAGIDSGFGNQVGEMLRNTLGATSMADGASGIVAMIPHLFSCGFSLLPAGLAMYMAGRKPAVARDDGKSDTYEMRIAKHTPCVKGQPCELQFQLVNKETGRELGEDELETVHTKKLHTMIVDSGLTDYHHIHPAYDSATKTFRCNFTPRLQTNYAMWNDFTIQGNEQPTQLKTPISINRATALVPRITHTSNITAGDLTIRIHSTEPLRQATPTTLTVEVLGRDGKPVADLEPIMGAYAHLAGFSAYGDHFIHSHPMGAEPQNAGQRGTGTLQFHLTPGMAGMNKFFLQIQREGRVVTVPFGQAVAPAREFSVRVTAEHPGHVAARAA